MDLSAEIVQIKRINQLMLDLLEQVARKQEELEKGARRTQQRQALSGPSQQRAESLRASRMGDRLWVRVGDICRSRKNPQSLLPISASTWYKGVQEGRFPKPHKLGRSNLWRLEDIKRLVSGDHEHERP